MGWGDWIGRGAQAELFGRIAGPDSAPGPERPGTGPDPGAGARPAGPSATAAGREGERRIVLHGHAVAYALRRSRRRTIGFQVGPDGLRVSAPRWVTLAQIEAGLVERGAWIVRKLDEQRERAARHEAARIDWRDGAVLPFLGRPLRIVLDPAATGVQLDAAPVDPDGAGAVLRVGLPADAGAERLRESVRQWMQRQARHAFQERIAVLAPRLGVRVRRLALSSAATRWGSAAADGSIRLNWRLIHFDIAIIDYVVAHELAHLLEMNHGPRFWALVHAVHPGVDAARRWLNEAVVPSFD